MRFVPARVSGRCGVDGGARAERGPGGGCPRRRLTPNPVEGGASELRVPTGEGRAEHKVRGSRFLALVRSASSLEAALAIRDEERRRFHDATHHVLAVRLADGRSRSDDDGEPAGTAGRPVLGTLAGVGLVDVAAIVTRWFGGVKLGTGGLSRAYAQTAAAAIETLPSRRVLEAFPVTLSFAYEDTGVVARLLEAARVEAGERRFGERTELDLAVACSEWAELERRLTDATAGRIRVRRGEGRVLVSTGP